jgi:hypothetical protein
LNQCQCCVKPLREINRIKNLQLLFEGRLYDCGEDVGKALVRERVDQALKEIVIIDQ